MSNLQNEMNILVGKMWGIVLRETKIDVDVDTDAANGKWFTIGNNTYIKNTERKVSSDKNVAKLVNAINALKD